MKLINFKIDDSMYPIVRRKVYTLFGLPIWSKSYVLTHVQGLNFAWIDDNGQRMVIFD